jgi:hypothetical protein
MISLTNTRGIEPQTLTQTATRPDGKNLVIFFPSDWRLKIVPEGLTAFSPTNEGQAVARGYGGFGSSSAFQNWLFSSVDSQCVQIGVDRRLKVNNLDIVIREYQTANKVEYRGLASIRIQDVSVMVAYLCPWKATTEYRTIFENSVKSVKFASTDCSSVHWVPVHNW